MEFYIPKLRREKESNPTPSQLLHFSAISSTENCPKGREFPLLLVRTGSQLTPSEPSTTPLLEVQVGPLPNTFIEWATRLRVSQVTQQFPRPSRFQMLELATLLKGCWDFQWIWPILKINPMFGFIRQQFWTTSQRKNPERGPVEQATGN